MKTLAMLCAAVWRIGAGLLVGASATALLVANTGLLSTPTALAAAGVAWAFLMGSIVIHEYAHWQYVCRYTTVLTWQHRLHLGIVHSPLPLRLELRAALAGPTAGLGYCLLFGVIGLVCGYAPLVWIAGLSSIIHLGSLLPNYGDGAIVWQWLRRRRSL